MKYILPITLWIVSWGQQIGYQAGEQHPSIQTSTCTKSGGCQTQEQSVVIDGNWRWTHKVGSTQNCYTGNEWDTSLCPDPTTCAQNCGLDGANYPGTYGVDTAGNAVTLKFVTHGQYSTNIGSRLYLLKDPDTYQTFQLMNREFTFDVDVSNLPCGLNGALYLVEMDADGGKSRFPANKAGARYGTGYCDAQCPHDIKFINGEANCEDWKPSPSDKNAGVGKFGTCCVEMDIWESNKMATAVTAHPCNVTGQTRCEGVACGDDASGDRFNGVCDKDGCDINPYRLGTENFFGPGSQYLVDSSKKITVVTQFITTDGTDGGDLKEIRRLFVQDGKVIPTPNITIGGTKYDSISDEFCEKMKTAFNDTNSFTKQGGLKAMGAALQRGSMVLVLSLWDDHAADMLWLDSEYPADRDPAAPGVARGPCPTSSGVPADVESQYPYSSVTYSNIKWGELDSTYSGNTPTPGDCPGGSLQACIGLCPSDPPAAYKACVETCVTRCT